MMRTCGWLKTTKKWNKERERPTDFTDYKNSFISFRGDGCLMIVLYFLLIEATHNWCYHHCEAGYGYPCPGVQLAPTPALALKIREICVICGPLSLLSQNLLTLALKIREICVICGPLSLLSQNLLTQSYPIMPRQILQCFNIREFAVFQNSASC